MKSANINPIVQKKLYITYVNYKKKPTAMSKINVYSVKPDSNYLWVLVNISRKDEIKEGNPVTFDTSLVGIRDRQKNQKIKCYRIYRRQVVGKLNAAGELKHGDNFNGVDEIIKEASNLRSKVLKVYIKITDVNRIMKFQVEPEVAIFALNQRAGAFQISLKVKVTSANNRTAQMKETLKQFVSISRMKIFIIYQENVLGRPGKEHRRLTAK